AFDNATGKVTLAGAYKEEMAEIIPAGVPYKIVTFRFTPAEVATLTALVNAIEAKLDSPAHGLAALKALIDAILVDTGTTLPTTLAEIAGYIDAEVAAILEDTATIDGHITADYGAAQKGAIDDLIDGGRLDLLIDLIKAQTDKIAGKMLFSMDFWSLPQEEVALTIGAGDQGLPSVSVADLPDGAAIVRAIAMFKFRMVENHTYAGPNRLDGPQEIQVAGDVDAINFVTGQFTLAETTREGGDVVIGLIDIAATVNANGAYAFHWDEAKAIQTGINFNDVQMGIRIWYS
ncbi:unnamed protein product, partial [marine sediment metagenome]